MTVLTRERILRDTARAYLAGEISYQAMTAIRRRVDQARGGEGERAGERK